MGRNLYMYVCVYIASLMNLYAELEQKKRGKKGNGEKNDPRLSMGPSPCGFLVQFCFA
jgi:hypothetical protein